MSGQRVPEAAYRFACGAVAHGNAVAEGEADPDVLAELAVDAAYPHLREAILGEAKRAIEGREAWHAEQEARLVAEGRGEFAGGDRAAKVALQQAYSDLNSLSNTGEEALRLPGFKRKRLAPGVTEYTRRNQPTNYDMDQPWITWRFLTTDRLWPLWRSNRILGRIRVEMTCAVCGESRVVSGRIPRIGEVKPPPGGKHVGRLRFMRDHLHKDASRHPMAWAQPLLNPAAHKGGIDLDALAMRLEADLLAADPEEANPDA